MHRDACSAKYGDSTQNARVFNNYCCNHGVLLLFVSVLTPFHALTEAGYDDPCDSRKGHPPALLVSGQRFIRRLKWAVVCQFYTDVSSEVVRTPFRALGTRGMPQ